MTAVQPTDLPPASSTSPRADHTHVAAPRWARLALPAALTWSFAMVIWALTWALGWLPHPFSVAEQVAIGAVLNAYDPAVGISIVVAIGALGTVTALAGLRRAAGRRTHRILVVVAWVLTAVLALVMVNGNLLSLLGYALVVPVLGWFEPGMPADFLRAAVEPGVLFVMGSTIGALLWGAVGLAGHRMLRHACIACGHLDGWDHNASAARRTRAQRVGRIAVATAVVMALTYPAARLPWLFGIPAGMDASSWAQLQASGGHRSGIGLGLAAIAGALLMTGLTGRWGERFPRWMVGLAGRRVPISLAVVPAATVALALIATGRGILPTIIAGDSLVSSSWLQAAPFVAMIPWGIALAVATAAYVVRRQGVCDRCGSNEKRSLSTAPTVESRSRP